MWWCGLDLFGLVLISGGEVEPLESPAACIDAWKISSINTISITTQFLFSFSAFTIFLVGSYHFWYQSTCGLGNGEQESRGTNERW